MSLGLKLTIKNYRCFDDSNPLQFIFREGTIAFVGPNNAGKSAILRFISELRGLWGRFAGPVVDANASLVSILRGGVETLDFHNVSDQFEVFTNFNSRPISIEFELIGIPLNSTNYLASGKILILRTRQFQLNSLMDVNTQLFQNGLSPTDALARLNNLDLKVTEPFFRALSNCFYIGAFRNAINVGTGNYFDLAVGTSFIEKWKNWKTGSHKAQNNAMVKLEEEIKDLFGFETFQINSSADSKSISIVADRSSFRLDEMGAGLSQFIVVLGNLAIKRPNLVLIDEPELNLHPAFQTRFITTIEAYSSMGIMFSSHSIGLARSAADQIYSVQKQGRSSIVKPWGTTKGYLELAGELSYSAWPEMGAGKILLCEGTTEVKALQHFLRLAKKDKDVLIIQLGGSSLINGTSANEIGELKRLNTAISVLIDSEKNSNTEPLSKEREQFVVNCKAHGYNIHVLERRAFENYLSDSAIKEVKGVSYSALSPYQEIKKANPSWAKSENWRITLHMTLDDLQGTDLHSFIQNL